MAVHRLRLTEDLAHLTALTERDKPEEVAWSRMSRSSIRVSQAQLEQFGDDFRALVTRYAELGAAAPEGEPTALVQLRLYAFPDLQGRRLPPQLLLLTHAHLYPERMPVAADGPPSPAGGPTTGLAEGSR